MNAHVFEQERPAVITTTGLTKKLGTLVAVNDLHLEVRQGDVFGFLGPNGSGNANSKFSPTSPVAALTTKSRRRS